MHASIQEYVDKDIISGASLVVLKDNKVVDVHCCGYMDKEAQKPMHLDSIIRIFSNTKIIVSIAAMCLYEDGCFQLDDPLEKYLPQLAKLKVLKAGTSDLEDTEPAKSKPTVRQLMSHSAGFSYGIFGESIIDPLYLEKRLLDPKGSLSQMVDDLAKLPLAYQPGTRWQYSVSTDVLARLIEVWSGKSIIDFLKARIFEPLNMIDTDFYVRQEKHERLAANYVPRDLVDPMKSGLDLAPDTMTGGYLEAKSFMSGGGGLVSTITDYTKIIQLLMGKGEFDGQRILKAETVALMHTNQLPPGIKVVLPLGEMPETLFGLGLAVKMQPAEGEPDTAIGEYHWGGLAGTHTWVSPKAGLAALIFTQRLPGFWHPFSHDFKRLVYQAVS